MSIACRESQLRSDVIQNRIDRFVFGPERVMLERVLASCCMLLLFGSVTYGQTKSAVFDGLVDTPSKLSGQPAFVQLMSGVVIENTEIVTFIQDRQTKSVTFVQYKDGRSL